MYVVVRYSKLWYLYRNENGESRIGEPLIMKASQINAFYTTIQAITGTNYEKYKVNTNKTDTTK